VKRKNTLFSKSSSSITPFHHGTVSFLKVLGFLTPLVENDYLGQSILVSQLWREKKWPALFLENV
jgi:hypothetical protein